MPAEARARVLMVDDQPSRLLSYETILAPLPLELVRAGSGLEALQCLMKGEFAVILLDVNMPDMDGFETAELIHQHPRHERTPIIFVTGVHVTDIDRLRGYSVGAFDYVYVPVVPEILRSKVSVLAELHGHRRELERVNAELGLANERLAEANQLLKDEKTRELKLLNEGLERANADLLRMMGQLQASDRRKDEFLAILGHELRNPLAPLHAAAQLIRRADLPETRRGPLHDMIERQVRHLSRLVDDLLDLSRISRDVIELQCEPVALDLVIARAIEQGRPLLDRRQQSLQVQAPDEPLRLHADPVRLTQVIANLLNNASKFSAEGARIEIELRRDDGAAIAVVRDPGIGIPGDMLDEIFEPFVRIDASGSGGLGIGLALTRKIVGLHGGSVEAVSAGPGRGAEFRVRLPLCAIETVAAPEAWPEAGCKGLRILLADDNRDAAESLALLLRLEGHEVAVAFDGLEAVQLARELKPGIVLLDLGMPGLDGYGAARQIRASAGAAAPLLIAVTGWGQDADHERSAAAGFDGHCVKPVSLQALRTAVEQGSAGAGAGLLKSA